MSAIYQWWNRLNTLPPLICNKYTIVYRDINYFNVSDKGNNDKFNKIREIIIINIINDKFDKNYYKYSPRWNKLKTAIFKYLIPHTTIECIPKAGRNNHYDFKIIYDNGTEHNVEFKFNACSIKEAPQFVSPTKPSQYFDINFEEWFYDNYLNKISLYGNLPLPDRDEYLKSIHSNKVLCMKEYKDKYDTSKSFNTYCKRIDKEAIKKFIEISTLDVHKLSKYLLNSQIDKEYMCYKDGKFYYDKNNNDIYKLIRVVDYNNTNIICSTKAGIKLEIKLRFKNGCGLQYPALQIQRKIPKVSELKSICEKNNIKCPELKADICKILDINDIIY